jgi:hypothetical protein
MDKNGESSEGSNCWKAVDISFVLMNDMIEHIIEPLPNHLITTPLVDSTWQWILELFFIFTVSEG